MNGVVVYEFVLFLHLLGVAALFIAIGVDVFSGVLVRRARTVDQLRSFGRMPELVGPVHGIGSLLLIGAGSYMASDRFSFTDGWVLSALVATVAFSILGPAVVAKRGKAIVDGFADAPEGPVTSEMVAAVHDPVLWMLLHGMAATALGILYLMTNKPAGLPSVAVLVVAFGIGAALGNAFAQRGRAHALAPAAAPATPS